MTRMAEEETPETPRCRAVVLSCIDYRFIEPLRHLLAAQDLTGSVDMVTWAGGAVSLTTADRLLVTEAMTIACELHNPDEVILAVHHDCGRLGGSARFAGRQAEIATLDTALVMAAEAAFERFPGLPVRLVRLDHDGSVALTDVADQRLAAARQDH